MISKYSINLFPFRIKFQFCPGAWSAGAETTNGEPLECREHPSQLVRSSQDYLMSRASPILSHSGIPADLSITHKRVRTLVWDPSPLDLFSLAGVWKEDLHCRDTSPYYRHFGSYLFDLGKKKQTNKKTVSLSYKEKLWFAREAACLHEYAGLFLDCHIH